MANINGERNSAGVRSAKSERSGAGTEDAPLDYFLGCLVKILRTAKGLSQAELANRLGVSQAFISAVESGKRHLGTEHLAPLAREFGYKVSEIVSFAEDGASLSLRELKALADLDCTDESG